MARGFTLLEIMLALFVFALLVGGVFSIAAGTTQLADEMEQEHERDAQLNRFGEFCGHLFRSLDGTARVRLRARQNGGQYLGQLAVQNAPQVFAGAVPVEDGITSLESEETPGGFLRVVLKTSAPENERTSTAGGTRLVLLENVARCDWRFFNPSSSQWESVWNESLPLTAVSSVPAENAVAARRPGLIELTLAIGADAPRRFVFWTPPAQTTTAQP